MDWIISRRMIIVYILFLNLANSNCAYSISSTEVCKICEGCLYGSISCQEPGKLRMIPNDLPSDIRKVIIIGQRFQSQFLQRENISSYSQPNMSIEQLTIMDCGLRGIEERTFYGLKSLTKLDISKNAISRIQRFTFAGLHLEQLRLDENMGLTLAAGAFENLTVNSLSMQNCGLQSLTFADMESLIRTGMLTTLRLTGNSLTTLDSSFEPLFLSLKAISLSQNPFNCDCELVWLTRFLQTNYHDTESDIPRLPVVLDDFPLNDDFTTSTGVYPVCHSPKRLLERKLTALTSSDFFCSPPILKALEINFNKATGLTISDSGLVNLTHAHLKCVARGSPELQLGWFRRQRRMEGGGSGFIFEHLPESTIVSPGVAEIVLIHQQKDNDVKSQPELLTCLGVDIYGNASADISLTWPLADKTNNFPSMMIPSGGEEHSLVDSASSRFEVLETTELHDLFFKKKFTILELFGAVLGTFTGTIILVLLGYCLLHNRRKVHHKDSHCLLRENSGVQAYHADTSLLTQKVVGYSIVTSNLAAPTTTTAYFPLEAINSAAYSEGQKEDAKVVKSRGIAFPSYDPLVENGSTYSEFPTYDLPQCHMIYPEHPIAPLPPIPASETPSQPSQSSSDTDYRSPYTGDSGKGQSPADALAAGYASSLYGEASVSTLSRCPYGGGDSLKFHPFNQQTLLVSSRHNQTNASVLTELLAQQRLLQTNLEAAQNIQRVTYGL